MWFFFFSLSIRFIYFFAKHTYARIKFKRTVYYAVQIIMLKHDGDKPFRPRQTKSYVLSLSLSLYVLRYRTVKRRANYLSRSIHFYFLFHDARTVHHTFITPRVHALHVRRVVFPCFQWRVTNVVVTEYKQQIHFDFYYADRGVWTNVLRWSLNERLK